MNKEQDNKKAFARLMVSMIDEVSSSKEAAEEYLRSEGIDVDAIVKENVELFTKYQEETKRPIDITEHSSIKDAYDLCIAIEELPPSEQATALSVRASDLLKQVALNVRFYKIREEQLKKRILDAPAPLPSGGKLEWKSRTDGTEDGDITWALFHCTKILGWFEEGISCYAHTAFGSSNMLPDVEPAKQWVETTVLAELRSLGVADPTVKRLEEAVRAGEIFRLGSKLITASETFDSPEEKIFTALGKSADITTIFYQGKTFPVALTKLLEAGE